MTTITQIHKDRFKEIKDKIQILGSEESRFIKVELLFYEVIAISRTYGTTDNILFSRLKHLEGKQYRDTQSVFNKRSQREKSIERFIVQLKSILNLQEE